MINIKELIPFMKDGWVAMDESGDWNWYKDKPECDNDEDYIWKGGFDLVCRLADEDRHHYLRI